MKQKHKTVFISAVIGNFMEYYDFTVYGVFSVIIGKTFFPVSSIFGSLAIFAMGFITRPIGGIVFGYIGDKYGRRISLICSMLGMMIPTFGIGFLPSYDNIGYLAPVLLGIMRLMQGLCLSGEGAGAAIFVLEHYGNFRPGLITGIVHGANIAGTIFASIVGIIIESYFHNIEFAWRAAFILGGLMGIIGIYFRIRVSETPIFKEMLRKKQTLKMPLFHVIQVARGSMLLALFIGGVVGSVVYLTKIYVNIFYQEVMGYDNATALSYLFYANFILMITTIFFGYLSDIVGKVIITTLATMSVLILFIPIFIMMSSNSYFCQYTAITLLASIGGAVSGTAYVFTISLFKPEERFTGVAFSYNLGVAIFGGTTPLVSKWLTIYTSVHYAPAFYFMLIAAIFLVVLQNKYVKNIRSWMKC